MQLTSTRYDIASGTWSAPLPAELDSERTLVLVFGASSVTDDHAAIRAIREAFPTSHLIGCSSAGEIHGTEVADDTVTVSVSRFANTDLRTAEVACESADQSHAVGRSLAAYLAGDDLRAVFVLSEGLGVNGSELVRGLNEHLPDDVVVTGGLSGDGARFEKTWVLTGTTLASGVVSAVGLYGDHLVVRHGSLGGWDMFGPEREVSRSENNVLFELDGRPALDLYKQYLGPKADELPASGLLFPLAMRRPDAPEKFLVRTLLAVDEGQQSMTFAGDIPQGATVQLMKANFERLIQGASGAAQAARVEEDLRTGSDVLAVAVSCVGRRLVLGERTDEEIEAIEEQIEGLTHITGFYSYGELSPFATGSCDLHNQTMTLTTFAESPTPIVHERSAGMKVAKVRYDVASGSWSGPLPTAMDSGSTLVTLFGPSSMLNDSAAVTRVQKAFPKSTVIGCSSAGEIHGTEVADDTLTVAVSRFTHTRLAAASRKVASADQSHDVGTELARSLLAKGDDLRAIFVLSEGLGVNGSELVRGFNENLPSDVVVTGGLSGDGARFEKTWVATDDTLASGLVAAVGLYGDRLVVRHGSLGGWDMFGPERTVTRSENNVLYELDDSPALDLYKQYLGPKADELPASGLRFPLAMRRSDDPEKFLVRTLLAVDDATHSMTFAGDIPQGATVQLMKANFERLIEGASGAATAARIDAAHRDGSDVLAIAVSCVGRRLVLGERTDEEIEAIEEHIDGLTHITGFYSYGELSPFASGACDLHNQTMTLTTFAEASQPVPQTAPNAVFQVPDDLINTSQGAPNRASLPPARVENAPAGGLAHLSYDLDSGAWSGPFPTELDSDRTLLLVFGAPEFLDDPRAFKQLRKAMPRSRMVGCSTAGEIHGTQVRDRSLAVTAYRFAHTDLQVASRMVRDASESYAAGQDLARELLKHEGLRAAFVLSEGLQVNGSELVRGLNGELPSHVVITGGLSGDGADFQRTWVCNSLELRPKLIVAVGLYGDHLLVEHGSQGGWDKFGPERAITRSRGNVVYELDGKPALDLYKQYLGPKAKDLPSSGLLFPLAVRHPDEDKVLVRTLLAVDEAERSLTFAGDVPQGHVGQLMKANFDRLVTGSSDAALSARLHDAAEDSPVLAVAVSCVGRRLVLGERIEEEVEAIRVALDNPTHITGFYSYGELSPFATGACDLHNQTMTLTVFGESATPRPRLATDFEISQPQPEEATIVFADDELNDPAEAAFGTFADEDGLITEPPMFTSHAPEPAAPNLDFDAFSESIDEDTGSAAQIDGTLRGPKATNSPADSDEAQVARKRLTLQHKGGGATASANLQVDIGTLGAFTVVTMAGRLTESFRGAQTGQRLSGDVIFDLHGVDRITSFGVREWLAMLDRMEVDSFYFARCSEAVINQVTMIRNFCGDGRIVSFFAPYLCASCGNEFSAMYDADLDGDAIRRHQSAPVPCPRCDAAAALDDDPWSYFSMGAQLATDTSGALGQALAELPKLGAQADPIEKHLDGRRTIIRFNTRLDASIRLRRVFDGLEGMVEIDLTNVPAATGEGADNFRRAISHLDQAVEHVQIEASPQIVLERLVASPPRRTTVKSAHVEARCGEPAVTRFVLVDVEANRTALLQGRDPVVRCDWCDGDLDWSENRELLQKAAGLGQKTQPTPAPAPRTVPASAPQRDPEPLPPGPRPQASQTQPMSPLVVAGATAAVFTSATFVVGALVLLAMNGRSPDPLAPPPATVTTAAMADVSGSEPVKPEPTLGWEGGSALPPGWAELPYTEEGDRIHVVGQGPGATPEAGLEAARQAAIYQLVLQLREDLRGSESYALLEASNDLADSEDGEGQAQVVDRFLEQVGDFATPTRTEVAVRTDEDGVWVAARYTLSRDALDQARGYYGRGVRFSYYEVSHVFPTLAPRLRSDANLVVTDPSPGLVNLGDLVLEVAGQPVYTTEAFDQRADSVWRSLPEGQRMTVLIESNGVQRKVRHLKKTQD